LTGPDVDCVAGPRAAQRDDGLVILPDALAGAAAVKAVKALLEQRLIQGDQGEQGSARVAA
jgi:hypothetical protein